MVTSSHYIGVLHQVIILVLQCIILLKNNVIFISEQALIRRHGSHVVYTMAGLILTC